MDASIYNEPWKVELWDLIQQAKAENKWLFTNSMATGPMWISPSDMEGFHKEKRYMWGVPNWDLRDPQEQLAQADREVEVAKAARDRIAASLRT